MPGSTPSRPRREAGFTEQLPARGRAAPRRPYSTRGSLRPCLSVAPRIGPSTARIPPEQPPDEGRWTHTAHPSLSDQTERGAKGVSCTATTQAELHKPPAAGRFAIRKIAGPLHTVQQTPIIRQGAPPSAPLALGDAEPMRIFRKPPHIPVSRRQPHQLPAIQGTPCERRLDIPRWG